MLSTAKFDYLIKQHKNRIFSYAVFMMKNRMDAEDITQEVLIRTWQNVNNFNFNAAKAWIMRTTHNLCVDHLRKNKTINFREQELDEEFHENIADKTLDGNPNILTAKNITEGNIKEAIEQLPERLKSPFVLFQIQGFKYKEISKILDVPLNTVKVNLLRARKQLQKELREYAKEEFK
jgi:RNA polymerase sigma-70 factor (ECF subfamily)